MEIRIDKEFESLIPPLSSDEFQQLEENIRKEGIRDPLVVWDGPEGYGILLDGHNRYGIANKYNIPFTTKRMHFSSREAAIEWIIKNQFGRRNLSAYDRSVLALKLKPLIQEKAKENLHQGQKPLQKSVNPMNTQKELAKVAGVSHDTIHKVEAIEEKATDKTKQLVREGKLSINQAYNSVHPKKPDPVKVAKEEHQQFQEQKASSVVSFNEAQVDKINQRIINNAMVQDIMKLNSTIERFGFEHRMEEIKNLADGFTDEFRNELLNNIKKSNLIIEVLANAIRR